MVSNPEFLREGSAVADFLKPDRVVIGSDDRAAAMATAELYSSLNAPIMITDPASAETIKYADYDRLGTEAAVREAGADRVNIALGTKRRVDLKDWVVIPGKLIGQHEVVRGDLGGDRDSARFCPPNKVNGSGGRQVTYVQPRTNVLGKKYVAGNDGFLGNRRPAGQTDFRGYNALVHLCSGGEARLLRVLSDNAIKALDVFQSAAHQNWVVDALTVIGKHSYLGSRLGHSAKLGKLFTFESYADGTHRVHVAPTGVGAKAPHLFNYTGGVSDRGGVCHGVYGGKTACSCGPGSALDGLSVLTARLTKVGVKVNESR